MTEERKKEDEIILPPIKTIKVAGEEVEIGKASLEQLIRASRLIGESLGKAFSKVKDKPELEKMRSGETSVLEDIGLLFEVLSENQVAELVGIVINRDRKFVRKHFDLDWVLDALIVFCELNDVKALLGKATRLSQVVKR